jgi:hypothetical protein
MARLALGFKVGSHRSLGDRLDAADGAAEGNPAKVGENPPQRVPDAEIASLAVPGMAEARCRRLTKRISRMRKRNRQR